MHPMSRSKENPLELGHQYIELVNRAYPEFEEILAKSPGIHPIDVEDFLDDANPETKEKLRQFGFFQSVEQKIHSEEQVLTAEELKLGMTLFLRQNDEVVGEIIVTKEPYKDESGWKVDYKEIGSSKDAQHMYLSDKGVTQYQNGLWNAWNWLEKPEKITALLRDKAKENLTALQEISNDYFDGGGGSILPLERQSVVTAKARDLVLAWTRGQLVKTGAIDRNHLSFSGIVYKDLEQEIGVRPYEEITSSLDKLSLTNHQKAGLKRRAWNLAKKALKQAKEA